MTQDREKNATARINLVPTRDMEENARRRVERAIEETIKNGESSASRETRDQKTRNDIHERIPA
jgi:hypothetical protein